MFIPLTIWFGIYYLDDRKYYFISMLVLLETTLPFLMVFEGHKPQERELVVISVLCAIIVCGRMAFFWTRPLDSLANVCIWHHWFFGNMVAFVIYGTIMNLTSVIMTQSKLSVEVVILACIRGIPFDLIHATSTFLFLLIASKAMLEKLDRIKEKYGSIK